MACSLRGEVTEATSESAAMWKSNRDDRAWISRGPDVALVAADTSRDEPSERTAPQLHDARASASHGSGEVRLSMAQISGMLRRPFT